MEIKKRKTLTQAKLNNLAKEKEQKELDRQQVQKAILEGYALLEKALKQTTTDNQEVIQALKDDIKTLSDAFSAPQSEDNSEKVISAIEALKLNPVIKVPEIKIPEPKVKVVTNDLYDQYKASDYEQTTSGSYTGFLDRNGNWFILRQSGLEGSATYRYVTGNKEYRDNWTKREILPYRLFSEVVFYG